MEVFDHPCFIGWFAPIFMVRVYHHPKGTWWQRLPGSSFLANLVGGYNPLEHFREIGVFTCHVSCGQSLVHGEGTSLCIGSAPIGFAVVEPWTNLPQCMNSWSFAAMATLQPFQ